MDFEEKKRSLKILLNDDSIDDAILSLYLKLAGDKIISILFPYGDGNELPSKYDFIQIELALYFINKRGAEGQISHSENGISRTYENADIPTSILNRITPYCGVIK